jgi:hypothetical protein
MRTELDRSELDEAIGTAPPSAVDVDAVIHRGRRTVRTRRTALAATAGAAAVVAVLGLTRLQGPPPPVEPAAPAPAASTGAHPGIVRAEPSGPVAPIQSSLGPVPPDIKARLDAALADRIAATLPAAGYLNPETGRPSPTPIFRDQYQAISPTQHGWEAMAFLKDAAGISGLRVLIFDYGTSTDACKGVPTPCTPMTRPDGEPAFQVTGRTPAHTPMTMAGVARPDGSEVEAWSFPDITDETMTGPGFNGANHPETWGDARVTPPLTAAQLEEIAADPRFTFHP